MSSCPSPSRVCYYDVFLSFRGVDTRKTVVSHLYKKLVARGIPTFKDDRKIGLGDSIPDELRRSIQSSRFAVVVISPNYATSRWCLEELRLMMELELNNEIGVIPVFYNVVPSDVKNLRGKFALTGLRSLKMAEKIPKWRQALTSIGNLQGTESSKCKDDAAMIEEVVGHISSRLSSMLPMDLEAIDGMKDHMEGLRPLLRMDSKNDEVRMIGIWGMGGIGKTSIAKYLYERHKHQFSTHHCFLEGVSSKQHGLLYLQKQLLSNILGDEDLKLWNLDQGANLIKSRLRNLKTLIVLDDVDDRDQLHFLAREVSWFGRGSRIIITTRDKSLLSSCNVYKVKCLNDGKALQLFQKIAFQGGKPPSSVYKDLSNRFSRIAQGLPLALETFGFYLRDKPLKQWQDALKSVEVTPYEKIMKVLKVSYDRLDKLGKTAFLHVACHFNGEPVQRVMSLLEQGEVRIRVLSEQSLIHISTDGCIAMHHLLEQMGRQIVRQDSGNSPAHQLILWHLDDIYPVLEDKAGTSNIEGMVLDVSMLPVGFQIKWDVFKLMHNLRFLKIYKLSGGLDSCRVDGLMLKRNLSVPRKLRLLHWDAYPFTTLPSSITPDCLVELKLCYSKLTTLWSGAPDLLHLRRLDLTGSEDLRELPDLQKAVHLEELILEGCTSLKRIPKSICSLSRLQKLDVSNCDGLKELRIKITELKCTVLQGKSFRVRSVCLNFYGVDPFLEDSQGISATNLSIKGNIKIELKRFGGFAEQLALNFEKQISPEELMTFELKSPPYGFKSLDIMRFTCREKSSNFKCRSFSGFPWLLELNLINLNIQRIPEDIHQMHVLEKLDLSGNGFEWLPSTMNLLTKLKHLTLCNCRYLEELPELFQLERLTLSDCANLRKLVNLSHEELDKGSYNLLELWLDNCNNVESLSEELSHFTRLTYLDLSRHYFETIPTSVMDLTSLVTISLNYCNNLLSLTGLPLSLKYLYAHGCKSLKDCSLPIKHSIDHLDLSPCSHWEQDSSQITRFPAGRRSKEVPLCACACFQETLIPRRDDQVTPSLISIILQRLKSWLCAFARFILVVGLAILLVTRIDSFTATAKSIQIYLNTLLMVIFPYLRL